MLNGRKYDLEFMWVCTQLCSNCNAQLGKLLEDEIDEFYCCPTCYKRYKAFKHKLETLESE